MTNEPFHEIFAKYTSVWDLLASGDDLGIRTLGQAIARRCAAWKKLGGRVSSCPRRLTGKSFSVLEHISSSYGLAQGTSRGPGTVGAPSDAAQGGTPVPAAYEPQGPVRLLLPQARVRI